MLDRKWLVALSLSLSLSLSDLSFYAIFRVDRLALHCCLAVSTIVVLICKTTTRESRVVLLTFVALDFMPIRLERQFYFTLFPIIPYE
jgi:hypothetical protein